MSGKNGRYVKYSPRGLGDSKFAITALSLQPVFKKGDYISYAWETMIGFDLTSSVFYIGDIRGNGKGVGLTARALAKELGEDFEYGYGYSMPLNHQPMSYPTASLSCLVPEMDENGLERTVTVPDVSELREYVASITPQRVPGILRNVYRQMLFRTKAYPPAAWLSIREAFVSAGSTILEFGDDLVLIETAASVVAKVRAILNGFNLVSSNLPTRFEEVAS